MKICNFPAHLCALTVALCGVVSSTHAGGPDFRLLQLDGQKVSWAAQRDRTLPVVVTYALIDEERTFDNARNCGRMLPPDHALDPSGIERAEFLREVREAFNMWSRVARIEFREVSDTRSANILIGAQAEPRGRAFTNVAVRDNSRGEIGQIEQSLICLNPAVRWKIGFDGNLDVYDIRYTMAHEIGHAIGLDHPGGEGQLMSYRYGEVSRDLRPGDIIGATKIYGANTPSPVLPPPSTLMAETRNEAAPPPGNLAISSAPAHGQSGPGIEPLEQAPGTQPAE